MKLTLTGGRAGGLEIITSRAQSLTCFCINGLRLCAKHSIGNCCLAFCGNVKRTFIDWKQNVLNVADEISGLTVNVKIEAHCNPFSTQVPNWKIIAGIIEAYLKAASKLSAAFTFYPPTIYSWGVLHNKIRITISRTTEVVQLDLLWSVHLG